MDEFGGMNFGGMGQGIGSILSGLFGNSGKPYKDYSKELQRYYEQAQGYQNPFWQAGSGAIPQFQQWLQSQQDPSGFINKLMGQYQESPFAKFQQQQGIRAGQNAGSASGLTGSTPLTQFMQENAQNISSQDMQNWLGNVLGINTQYGAGLGGMMGMGQNAANSLSALAGGFGGNLAESRMRRSAMEQRDRNNLWGGLFNTGISMFGGGGGLS